MLSAMTLTASDTLRHPWAGRLLDVALAMIIFVVALGPRLDIARSYDTPIQSEERLYDRYAWPWAQGEGAEPREKPFPWHPLGSFTHRPPLYSLFVGAVYRLEGHDFQAVRLAQALLGALTCVLTFIVGRQVGNRWVGLGAGLFLANYSFLIGFTARLMSETLFIFLMMAALALLLWARNGSLGALFAASLVMGLANLTRPVMLLPFLVFLVVWLWFIPGFRRRPLHALVALGLGLLLTIGPVVVRNYQFHGRLVLISSNSGFTFYHGLARTPTLTDPAFLQTKEAIQDLGLGELEEQAVFRQIAVQYLQRYPQDIPAILWTQWEEFLVANQGYKVSDIVIPAPEDPIVWPLIGWGAILSLFLFPRRQFHPRALLYITILAQVLMGLIFHMEVRYRLPLVPLHMILTCWLAWNVVAWLWRIVQTERATLQPRSVD